jgi:hexosaminidase
MKKILPAVKSMMIQEGLYHWPLKLKVYSNKQSTKASLELKRFISVDDKGDILDTLSFIIDPLLNPQAYRMVFLDRSISIHHRDQSGAFYAIKTLKQLCMKDNQWENCTIYDEPDLKVRGYLLDISRNKIPTQKTLYQLIDLLADLKYNHFELYVEGFSFKYPSFESLYTDETPITIEDFKKLENYCIQRCIDFVPNHNGLGHMTAWLERPQFKDLANIEEGMFMWGAHRKASTLNPLDPRSLDLVKTYTSDVLKISKSPYFHLNLDEPYELGLGKTELAGKEIGVGQMYLDYMLKLYDHVKSYGKIPLVWGDVLNHYPETLSKLPKDLIFVDWGYDSDAPFYRSLKRLSEANVAFMSAPGTSSWNSLTGRTYDSLENINNACLYTKLYNGIGFLLTDWGDNGHPQPLAISYLPLIYGAFVSWSSEGGAYRHSIDYLNDNLFQDERKLVGEVSADLGRLYRFQNSYTYNSTQIFDLLWAASDGDGQDLQRLKDHPLAQSYRNEIIIDELKSLKKRLLRSHSETPIGKASGRELLEIIQLTQVMMLSFELLSLDLNLEKNQEKLHLVLKLWPQVLKQARSRWLRTNRRGGLEESMASFEKVHQGIKQLLKV